MDREAEKQCALWYQHPGAGDVLEQLNHKIEPLISNVFGYHALEMGVLSGKYDFLKSSRVTHHFQMSLHEKNVSLSATPEHIPITFDEVDLLVASHALECSDHPHQVLREIERVLVPEGHCILIGFNPISCAGIGRLFRLNKSLAGYKHFYTLHRVRDWFGLLGFEVLNHAYVDYRPRMLGNRLNEKLSWLDDTGKKFFPVLGSLYIIHAQKKTEGMIIEKKKWRPRRIVPNSVTVGSASRGVERGRK